MGGQYHSWKAAENVGAFGLVDWGQIGGDWRRDGLECEERRLRCARNGRTGAFLIWTYCGATLPNALFVDRQVKTDNLSEGCK